jgi:hypothetical protein
MKGELKIEWTHHDFAYNGRALVDMLKGTTLGLRHWKNLSHRQKVSLKKVEART